MMGFCFGILTMVSGASAADVAHLTRCVRGPTYHCDVVWWSSNEDLQVFKCVGVPPECMVFDRDGDRDVDLLDFANVTAPGPRRYGDG
jgi:hypothetical protein